MIFSAIQLSTLLPLSAICLAYDITLWAKCKRQKGKKWQRPAATETPDVTGIPAKFRKFRRASASCSSQQ